MKLPVSHRLSSIWFFAFFSLSSCISLSLCLSVFVSLTSCVSLLTFLSSSVSLISSFLPWSSQPTCTDLTGVSYFLQVLCVICVTEIMKASHLRYFWLFSLPQSTHTHTHTHTLRAPRCHGNLMIRVMIEWLRQTCTCAVIATACCIAIDSDFHITDSHCSYYYFWWVLSWSNFSQYNLQKSVAWFGVTFQCFCVCCLKHKGGSVVSVAFSLTFWIGKRHLCIMTVNLLNLACRIFFKSQCVRVLWIKGCAQGQKSHTVKLSF